MVECFNALPMTPRSLSTRSEFDSCSGHVLRLPVTLGCAVVSSGTPFSSHDLV